MTAKEIRDVGFLSWRDPDAWMEAMRGPRWNALVKEENELLEKALKTYTTPHKVTGFKEILAKARTYYNTECFKSGPVHITPTGTFTIRLRFEGTDEFIEACDVATNSKYIVYTHDIGDGAEKYELVVLDAKTRKEQFRIEPVGPNISIDGGTLYYLGVTHKLWYNKLFSTSLDNKHPIQLYEEKDGHYNLELNRTYLIRENSGKTDTFYIKDNVLTQLQPGSERQVPIDEMRCFYKNPGNPYNLPKGIVGRPFWADKNHVLTRKMGETRLYELESLRCLVHLTQGDIQPGEYNKETRFRIDDGITPPYILNKSRPEGFNLKQARIQAKSSDGTRVTATIIYKGNKPNSLFATGYGAYGIPSSAAGAYSKWAPLLENGWGILYTYLRGGGDDTDAWANAGRLEGRTHTRDDFLALVEAAQHEYSIGPKNTVIYGRSAGGFLMGMCINKEPTGKLFEAVYTEVPYVDVLRTTTNPDLPLTKMEYNEFGDPAHRPQDFGFLVDLSPADVAITTEAPNIFVLARTGLNDSEVYAYEPVKWIRRLRKSGDKELKVIGIATNEGHFYSPETALQAKAEDLAILHYRLSH